MQPIDPIEHIRKNPTMYLPFGRSSGPELASMVVVDALVAVDGPVVVRRVKGWYVIAGEVDWLPAVDEAEVQRFFSKIVADTVGGPTAFHREVVLSVYADEVITAREGRVLVVKGAVSPDNPIWPVVADPRWRRVVAFRLADGHSGSEHRHSQES